MVVCIVDDALLANTDSYWLRYDEHDRLGGGLKTKSGRLMPKRLARFLVDKIEACELEGDCGTKITHWRPGGGACSSSKAASNAKWGKVEGVFGKFDITAGDEHTTSTFDKGQPRGLWRLRATGGNGKERGVPTLVKVDV